MHRSAKAGKSRSPGVMVWIIGNVLPCLWPEDQKWFCRRDARQHVTGERLNTSPLHSRAAALHQFFDFILACH